MAWVVPVAGILWRPGDRGSVQPKDNGGDVVLGTALESGCDNGFGDLLRVVSIVEYPGQCQVVDSIGDPIRAEQEAVPFGRFQDPDLSQTLPRACYQ